MKRSTFGNFERLYPDSWSHKVPGTTTRVGAQTAGQAQLRILDQPKCRNACTKLIFAGKVMLKGVFH